MTVTTDYVVRSTARVGSGPVTYTVVDLVGQVYSVAVAYRDSLGDRVDPIIRSAMADFRQGRAGR